EAKSDDTTPLILNPEDGLPIPFFEKSRTKPDRRLRACLLLHLDGKAEALKHPLAQQFLERKWLIVAPDLRGTGETKPAAAAIAGAPDHNSAEHGLWLNRPLLGQWVFDVQCLLDWMAAQPTHDADSLVIVGIGQAGVIAVCAAGLLEERAASVAIVDSLSSYVTAQAYATGTSMGLLAPGILKVGDIPQIAALSAPRRLVISGGISPQGKRLTEKELKDAYGYTSAMYKVLGMGERLIIRGEMKAEEIAGKL